MPEVKYITSQELAQKCADYVALELSNALGPLPAASIELEVVGYGMLRRSGFDAHVPLIAWMSGDGHLDRYLKVELKLGLDKFFESMKAKQVEHFATMRLPLADSPVMATAAAGSGGVSLRSIVYYDAIRDQNVLRIDCLYAMKESEGNYAR